MHHGDPETLGFPARQHSEIGPPDVRVVQAGELDRQPVEVDLAAGVVEPVPAVRLQELDELWPSARLREPGPPTAVRDEVPERVEGARGVEVVRAEHKPRGEPAPGGAHGGDRGLDGLGLG